jgi:hypothetical protein
MTDLLVRPGQRALGAWRVRRYGGGMVSAGDGRLLTQAGRRLALP